MTTPRTRQAYFALYEILDRALESSSGIRMTVESYNAGVNLRMRLHAARQIDRETNAKIHEPGMPLHWASIYDVVQVRPEAIDGPDGQYYLIIEPAIPRLIGQIEPLAPNPESYAWRNLPDGQRPTILPSEEAPSFLPNTGSPIGTKLLSKNSESSSELPSDDSSSTPSTKPEPEPATQGLRRL